MNILYKKEEIKTLNLHNKTLGAFVQQPNPTIVGIAENKVISSIDAKSLYPTIMALMNIGYDTLYARVYDPEIVEPLLNLLEKSKLMPESPARNLPPFIASTILDLGSS